MIYVASQEGLPGFLFHLQKKELCWNVIRELGIKLTAAFCFPCERVSPLDSGIWLLHWQPELNGGKDQLEKGLEGRATFLNGRGFSLSLLYLSWEDVFVAADFRRQSGSCGLEYGLFFAVQKYPQHQTSLLCFQCSFSWREENKSPFQFKLLNVTLVPVLCWGGAWW